MSENVNEKLKASLREYAEWAESHIYEVPIVLPDCLAYAACRIEGLEAQIVDLNKTLEQVKAERDRYWQYIKGLGCDTCGGDCDRCEVTLDRVWTGWEWAGEKEEKRDHECDATGKEL
jgi:hypothetical protein